MSATKLLIASIHTPEHHSHPDEKWLTIEGHENYMISNQHRVWSNRQQIRYHNSIGWVGGEFVKLHKLKKGLQVHLPTPMRKFKKYLVRDLVKAAFPDLT